MPDSLRGSVIDGAKREHVAQRGAASTFVQ